MKKIFVVLAVLVSTMVPAHAEPVKAIAIIDMGANTSLFTNVVTEVCIVEMLTCPNGKSFMEGKGAANTGVPTNKAVDHGTNMASIVTKVNPNVGIIPIRIATTNATGALGLYSNASVKLALDWVVANRAKYNIVAVSVSQGKIFAGCTVPAGTAQDVDILKANNVPVIAAAGNSGDAVNTMAIACLPNVISVGATDNPDPGVSGIAYCATCAPTIARYSNGNPTLYVNGRWYVTQGNGTTKFTVGTSNATAAFAAWWVLKYQDSYSTTFKSITDSAVPATGVNRTGKYIPTL